MQDKRIPQEKRERFEALDLEVLLSEFKAVAVMAQGKEEEESDEREAEGAQQPGADEIEWLREAGFPSLAETHLSGARIGEAEVVGLTEVLSPEMAATVRKRVSFLNGLLGDGGGDGGGAAAAPAAPAKSEPLEIPGGPSRGNSDQAKTPPRSPPSSIPRRSVSEHNGARRAPSRTAEVTEVPTRFDDLGDGDKAQLQYLNVVHLTTILESKKIFKISKTAHKAKMKKGTEVGCCSRSPHDSFGHSFSFGDRRVHRTDCVHLRCLRLAQLHADRRCGCGFAGQHVWGEP